jgi:peptide/nickel transport system permease protein
MWYYIIRRLLYAIPILIGVNIITFMLFFMVNTPNDMAYMHLGNKYVTKQQVSDWKQQHGYDLPLFYNKEKHSITQTIFWQKSVKLFVFDFGASDHGQNINQAIAQRYGPSLSIAIPTLILGMFVNIILAMLLAFFRGTYLDTWGTIWCVVLMSISLLFYIVAGQYLVARILKWLPISGYGDGIGSIKFVLLPVLVGVLGGIGANVRWYRTFFLEELNQDYVRTARAKGLSEPRVFFIHVLRNSLIPILTGVVVILPLLFMGSLIMESFFGIPGLGSYTMDAIRSQDFAIVRAMVFLGTVLYILGLILTDISYVLVDPRVKLS